MRCYFNNYLAKFNVATFLKISIICRKINNKTLKSASFFLFWLSIMVFIVMMVDFVLHKFGKFCKTFNL